MPNLEEIMESRNKKSPFKKRPYRSWNLEGEESPSPTLVSKSQEYAESIVELDCDKILNWKFSDRPANELGDIDLLAKDLLKIGQQQPCVVRPHSNKEGYYELIIGERRWEAAKKVNIPLKVIIRNLDDSEAAIVQVAENDKRVGLSDYAKFKNYEKLINHGIIKRSELSKKLNIDRMQASRLMSFQKIPDEIINNIVNWSNISARTAAQIVQLSAKGENYKTAIIKLSKKLNEDKIGHEKLTRLVENIVRNENILSKKRNEGFLKELKSNIDLIKIKQNTNSDMIISFPAKITEILSKKKGINDKFKKEVKSIMKKLLETNL